MSIYSEKPWLKHYPEHVPQTIDQNHELENSLSDLLLKACHKFQEAPAFCFLDRTISYAELETLSTRVAAFLQQELGLKKGDRLVLMLPNCLQYPVVLLAALRIGVIVVNTNPLYTANELRRQLEDSQPAALVVLENFAHTIAEVMKKLPLKQVIVSGVGDLLSFPKNWIVNFSLRYLSKKIPAWKIPGAISFRRLMQCDCSRLIPVEIRPEDTALLQYTGGTTGIAKGAMLTHRNLVANLHQAWAWVSPALREREEVIITAIPLYHIFAFTANGLLGMMIGAKNVLIPDARRIKDLILQCSRHPFSILTGVNTLFNALLHHRKFRKLDFSKLKIALAGGMTLHASVAEQWQKLTSKNILEAYGLTETSPAVTINPTDLKQYNGSIGLPVPSTEITIRDDEGEEVALGDIGELWVRGPQVMKGYWNLPEETAKVLTHDGWLKTGDMARMDDQGFLYLVDRKKDLIIVSGFNVYPNEIEAVLNQHPGVLESGVVGIADATHGERIKAFVVKSDPKLTEKMLRRYLKRQLVAYKLPHWIEFREELPKTNVGKILRRALREG